MPFFRFTCQECQKEFGTILGQYNQEVQCPFCNSKKVKRLWGSNATKYKGEGFYSTDYRAEGE